MSCDCSSDVRVGIGIGIGIVLGLDIVFLALVFGFLYRRRTRKQNIEKQETTNPSFVTAEVPPVNTSHLQKRGEKAVLNQDLESKTISSDTEHKPSVSESKAQTELSKTLPTMLLEKDDGPRTSMDHMIMGDLGFGGRI